MREALITAVQRAIVLYVTKNEGKKYAGDNTFKLTYIRRSKNIPEHRKRDIEALNQMFLNANTNNISDIKLAKEIYNYLSTIKTGVMFLWLFHIGNSSVMRDLIHNALYLHDSALFLACKEGRADRYQRDEKDNSHKIILTSHNIQGEQENNVAEQYINLKKENSALQIRLQDAQKNLNISEQRNTILSDSLNQQYFVNSSLRKKMNKIQKKPAANNEQIEMSPCRSKTEDALYTDPNQVNTRRSIS